MTENPAYFTPHRPRRLSSAAPPLCYPFQAGGDHPPAPTVIHRNHPGEARMSLRLLDLLLNTSDHDLIRESFAPA